MEPETKVMQCEPVFWSVMTTENASSRRQDWRLGQTLWWSVLVLFLILYHSYLDVSGNQGLASLYQVFHPSDMLFCFCLWPRLDKNSCHLPSTLYFQCTCWFLVKHEYLHVRLNLYKIHYTLYSYSVPFIDEHTYLSKVCYEVYSSDKYVTVCNSLSI